MEKNKKNTKIAKKKPANNDGNRVYYNISPFVGLGLL